MRKSGSLPREARYARVGIQTSQKSVDRRMLPVSWNYFPIPTMLYISRLYQCPTVMDQVMGCGYLKSGWRIHSRLPSEVVEAIMAHVRRAKRAHFLAVYLQRQANAALLEMQGRLYGFQRRIRDGGGEVVLPGPRYYGPGY